METPGTFANLPDYTDSFIRSYSLCTVENTSKMRTFLEVPRSFKSPWIVLYLLPLDSCVFVKIIFITVFDVNENVGGLLSVSRIEFQSQDSLLLLCPVFSFLRTRLGPRSIFRLIRDSTRTIEEWRRRLRILKPRRSKTLQESFLERYVSSSFPLSFFSEEVFHKYYEERYVILKSVTPKRRKIKRKKGFKRYHLYVT